MTSTTETTHETEIEAAPPRPDGRVVVFVVDAQRYALPIENVLEIQRIVAFSDVPGAGREVLGMVNLRGQVIPALDARVLLGGSPVEHGLEAPMVIARSDDESVAIVVDEVDDVLAVAPESVQEPPARAGLADKILGVARIAGDLVYLIDVDALFSATDVEE